ncbi:hypothetical protein AALB39_21790 [Lachnospiraceae bacterium 54-53]
MANGINILKGVLLCAAGVLVLFLPYEKFQSIFPAAKSRIFVKTTGGIILLCGLFVMFIVISEL